MTNPQKKISAEAATSTETKEHLPKDNSDKESTNMYAHLLHHGKSTGIHHVTWAGEKFLRKGTVNLLVTLEDARLMANSPQSVTICKDCIEEQAEHYREQQRREEERKQLVAEQEARAIKAAQEFERNLKLIEAHRKGDTETATSILDELVQEDDEALKRAGLTSWDEGDDD